MIQAGNNSPWVSSNSACLSRDVYCLCPKFSFQGCLDSEQPQKYIVPLYGIRTGLLTAHYIKIRLPKFRAPLLHATHIHVVTKPSASSVKLRQTNLLTHKINLRNFTVLDTIKIFFLLSSFFLLNNFPWYKFTGNWS